MPLIGQTLDKSNSEERISCSREVVVVTIGRWLRHPCSHRYLIGGSSYPCHLFDVTVATGAEGGPLGTGVAVHLSINFTLHHGLSEQKKKNRKHESIQGVRMMLTLNELVDMAPVLVACIRVTCTMTGLNDNSNIRMCLKEKVSNHAKRDDRRRKCSC